MIDLVRSLKHSQVDDPEMHWLYQQLIDRLEVSTDDGLTEERHAAPRPMAQ